LFVFSIEGSIKNSVFDHYVNEACYVNESDCGELRNQENSGIKMQVL